MDSKVCVFQLALLGVALALAGPNIAAGGMKVGLASKAAGAAHAARQMMAQATMTTTTSVMGLEVHRRILASTNPSSSLSSLDPNRAACINSCPARGGPYTGPGCKQVYQCPSS